MGISGTDKALVYALGGVARGGATRGGGHSPKIFISIGGVQFATAPDATGARVLHGSLQINKSNGRAHTATFLTRGFFPVVGLETVITMGSKNSGRREFGGHILTAEEGFVGTPENYRHSVTAIDFSWPLTKVIIRGRYTGSASTIARDLFGDWAPEGYSADYVEDDLDTVDGGITFTNVTLWDAIVRLAARIGGYAYIDYFKCLHFYASSEPWLTAPQTITSTLPTLLKPDGKPPMPVVRTIGSMVTRAYVEGGGGRVLTAVDPGDTTLPVDAPEWYQGDGGEVIVGHQVLSYDGVELGGGGGLVGPGAAPSVAPTVAPDITNELTVGTRLLAVTFVTAGGETLPGPTVSVVYAQIPDPSTAPPATAIVGGSMVSGVYEIAYFWEVDSSGPITTLLSPVTTVTVGETISTGALTPPTDAPSASSIDVPAGDGSPGPFFNIGDQVSFATSFRTATGETTIGPWSSALTIIESVSNPGRAQSASVTNVQISADSGVTRRHIYIRRNGVVVGYLVFIGNSSTGFGVCSGNGNSGAPPLTNTATGSGVANSLTITVPVGPAGVVRRRVFVSGPDGVVDGSEAVAKFAINDNTTTTLAISTPVSVGSGGAPFPSANNTPSYAYTVNDIPIGPAGVTGRNVYRSAADDTELKLMESIGDNTTTSISGELADGSLGVAAPTVDTSGLDQPTSNQVQPGETSIPVAGLGGFLDSGGWARIGNGQQIVRYTGKTSTHLTGIPASGAGAITAAITWNSTITALALLTGIPASGEGAILDAIPQGEDANLWVTVDDDDAQALLASRMGGDSDGVFADMIPDRRLSYAECVARGRALVAQQGPIDERITLTSRDRNLQPGQLLPFDLETPSVLNPEYRIQEVVMRDFEPELMPRCEVTVSAQRFSFEDLLDLARKAG